jgi:hypothetical protein
MLDKILKFASEHPVLTVIILLILVDALVQILR